MRSSHVPGALAMAVLLVTSAFGVVTAQAPATPAAPKPAAPAPAPAPPAQPLPVIEPGYVYQPDGRRDPFVSLRRPR